jgi:hypothetical protein
LSVWACGGGGGSDDDAGGAATTIEGRVERVASAALAGGGAGTSSVEGIRVEARHDARVLDVTTTDVEGRFTLQFVSDGTVELLFVTEGVELALGLTVVPGTVVTLVVELRVDDDEVVIIDEEPVDGRPIRCETGSVSISDPTLDLLIDGNGDDCIRTGGNCVVDIDVRSLTLVGCERCIRAEGGSEVRVLADPGAFVCEAFEDGIRAGGNSIVLVDALTRFDIDSGSTGIRADGTAGIAIGSAGTCRIEADEDAIRSGGAAVVDLDACFAVDLDDDVPGDDDDDFDDDD